MTKPSSVADAGLGSFLPLPQWVIIRSVSQKNYKWLHFIALLRNYFAWSSVVLTADVLCTVFIWQSTLNGTNWRLLLNKCCYLSHTVTLGTVHLTVRGPSQSPWCLPVYHHSLDLLPYNDFDCSYGNLSHPGLFLFLCSPNKIPVIIDSYGKCSLKTCSLKVNPWLPMHSQYQL